MAAWRCVSSCPALLVCLVPLIFCSAVVADSPPGMIPISGAAVIEVLPIQLGAMNTGFGPGLMLMDEVRFSRVWRYGGDYQPADRAEVDADTTLLPQFDGDLQAESGLEGAQVAGEPGTVG